MLERLSASLRHEHRFTAELSHELRTPLAKIAAESELALRRERTSEDYRESLTAVARNAEQMSRTVEALVAAARHEAGPGRTTTDARAGVQLAVEGIRDEAARSGIVVRMTLPTDEARVAIESDLVERIVHPLLDNALRYGRCEVSVGLVPAGPNVTITVSDDGAGIAIDEATRIFEPGIRGSAGAADQRGAGLGLALARRLARSAGGEITAHTDTTGGRFTVHLPTA
jgi:signal transduction histidine kinase